MNRYLKLPARFLLVLLGTILIAAGMTSVSLADTATDFHGRSNFEILEATSTWAHFTIDDSCNDTDENCTVIVGSNVVDDTITDIEPKPTPSLKVESTSRQH